MQPQQDEMNCQACLSDAICSAVIKAMAVVAYHSAVTSGAIKPEEISGRALHEYRNDPLFHKAANNAVYEIRKALEDHNP